ncbi:MAG: GNAT family N-acetyltransferase [Lachnospiraceae bacterium]|nr:GNAT family N-acetyltransferase [Lachnospiraceae bacterium]
MVVPVTDKNIDEAARIHSISWQESHRSFCDEDFINKHNTDHQREYIDKKIKNGSRFYLLCDKAPIAVVSITDGLIEDLYVLPEHQNRGYGTQLLDYVLAVIDRQEVKPTLWILANNDGAKRLYLRKGFVPTGKVNAITDKLDEIEYVYN